MATARMLTIPSAMTIFLTAALMVLREFMFPPYLIQLISFGKRFGSCVVRVYSPLLLATLAGFLADFFALPVSGRAAGCFSISSSGEAKGFEAGLTSLPVLPSLADDFSDGTLLAVSIGLAD